MRGAAVLVLVAGCAEATGLILTVAPGDTAVKDADTLEVIVGRGATDVPTLDGSTVVVHADNGLRTTHSIEAFTKPVDLFLEATAATEPFFVTVRAIDSRRPGVLGEGGVSGPIEIRDGTVVTATAIVTGVETGDPLDPYVDGYMPNCPGLDGYGGQRHYIVADLDQDDCDGDGQSLAAQDCDDFDASFNASADDRICDDLDHTCGTRPLTTTARCFAADPNVGGCYLGSAACIDGMPEQTGDCTTDPAAPVPTALCTLCPDAMDVDDLRACLPQANQVEVSCHVKRTATGFCLPLSSPDVGLGELTWYQDGQPVSVGRAQWVDQVDEPRLEFGWREGDNSIGAVTQLWPPSPAIIWDGQALPSTLSLPKAAAVRTSADLAQIWFVAVSINLEPACDGGSAQPDCIGIPIGP